MRVFAEIDGSNLLSLKPLGSHTFFEPICRDESRIESGDMGGAVCGVG